MVRASDRVRLDEAVVDRGLAETRARAQALIQGGGVTVDGQVVTKPALRVGVESKIELVKAPLKWVSRGGLKLEHALAVFDVSVRGKTTIDVGASTGGFTHVLLDAGAARVYAVDVGYGQLAWTLRNEPRVVVMERTNIRDLASLPEPIELGTVDVSFISLRLVLPALARLVSPGSHVVALVKPQFEAGREQVDKGAGVVRDERVWREVLQAVVSSAEQGGWGVLGIERSPVRGPAGNVEFLIHLRLGMRSVIDTQNAIARVI